MHIVKIFFVFFLLVSVACTVYPFNWNMKTKTKLTSPCNAFPNFVIDPRSRPVGDTSWPNGCPEGRYMTAVWSPHATEPFETGKCCGTGVSDENYSWQISNLQFYGGGSDTPHQPWNIECSKQSVITGFRFMSNNLGLRLLSDVRCSMLINKLVNQSQCIVLDFTKQAKNSHNWNETWTHECPTGYAMTAVYDDQGFVEVKKAKCCQLFDNEIRSGWKSSFRDNLSGFLQSKTDNFDYTVQNFLQSPTFTNTGVLHHGVVTSPAIRSDKRICLLVQTYLFAGTSLSVNIRTNTSVRTVKTISSKYIATTKVLINEPKTYQLELVGNIAMGYIWIIFLEFAPDSECDVDRCTNFPPSGCGVNEICQPLPPLGRLDCACRPGYVKIGGVCIHTPTLPSTAGHSSTPTTPKDVDPDGKSGDTHTDDPRRPYWTEANRTASASTVQTTATLEREKDSAVESVVPKWMYALTAALITIALAAIVILIVIAHRANRNRQNKHHAFYDVHMQELAPTNTTASRMWYSKTSKSSRSTQSSYCTSTDNIYRPYLEDLGTVVGVEGTTPTAYNNSAYLRDDILREEEILPGGKYDNCVLDTNINKEPIYTRIIRSISDATDIDVEALHGGKGRHDAAVCDRSLLRRRRLSHYTLDAPVYGENDEHEVCTDSTSSEQATVERLSSMEEFFIPGDNEEELIDELNELNVEKISYTTQQLGEGAFGVVKLADYTDVGMTKKVAIKSIKEREDYEITESDRINLYQEAVIMMQFEHPNVISLLGVVVGAAPAMVMEYVSHGNLHKYLRIINRTMRKKQLVTPTNELHQTFLRWAREIAAGMEYLEKLKFIHRDIACRNILLNGDFSCKISDFGLARGFLKDYQYYVSHGGQIPVKWTAPEALQFKRYSCASDVWSFAVVLWEIWSFGKVPYSPWKNDQVITEVCENGYRLPPPEGCPRVLHSIMSDCWNDDRRKRPTFSQVRYCLSYGDERILGKEASLNRTRSRTICNLLPDDQSTHSDVFTSRTG